jgi:hypothetical protein
MVIDDLRIPGRSVAPDKAEAEVVVDPNAPLSGAIAGEFFQSVLRWYAQGFDPRRCVQHLQFSHGYRSDVGESCDTLSLEQGFGVSALERLDHAQY